MPLLLRFSAPIALLRMAVSEAASIPVPPLVSVPPDATVPEMSSATAVLGATVPVLLTMSPPALWASMRPSLVADSVAVPAFTVPDMPVPTGAPAEPIVPLLSRLTLPAPVATPDTPIANGPVEEMAPWVSTASVPEPPPWVMLMPEPPPCTPAVMLPVLTMCASPPRFWPAMPEPVGELKRMVPLFVTFTPPAAPLIIRPLMLNPLATKVPALVKPTLPPPVDR